MNNRVDTASLDPIIRFRMASILTDSGAQINIGYSAQECVKGTNMPATPDSNTKRCFPVYWTPPGQTAPTLDWFHKYLVTNVTVVDTAEAGSAPDTYAYSYLGAAAWHYDDSEFVPASRKTWGQWRGYPKVRVTHGQDGNTQTQTDTVYFQGMNGDHLASGATRAVTVAADPDFGGPAINDEPWRRGLERESITYNGTGDAAPVVAKTLTTPWEYGPTATRTRSGVTVNAYLTGPKSTSTKTALDGGRGWRTTLTVNTFDAEAGLPTKVGRVVRQDDQGDTAVATDDRCTRTTYAENTAAWLLTMPVEVETVGVNCATTPNRAVDVLSDTRTWYDGATAYGTAVGKGDATRTERLAAWNAGSPTYQQLTRSAFDAYGRVTDAYDPLDRHTTTAYTPSTGGPVTATTVTNPYGWTTVGTLEPAWGSATRIVDANGHRTDMGYDGLGRKTAVWLPDRGSTLSASLTFGYQMHNDGYPNAVVVSTLNTGGTGYHDEYVLYDSLLRPRQDQKAAPGGGRIITDTFYDTRGLAYLTDAAYFSAASPGVFLAARSTVPTSTLTTYDGAGRVTAAVFRIDGVERWRTTTAYGGDHVDVAPPAGGTATSTWVDAHGQTTALRQYHGSAPTGAYDATTYGYTRAGDLATVVDTAGNTWHFGYDQQRRKITEDDPDAGHSAFTYDGADNLLTSTDARAVLRSYTYDLLNRRVGEYQGTVTPAHQVAAWTWDTAALGQPTGSTRYVGGSTGSAYTRTVTGYDAAYRVTGSTVTIPAAEGALAGTYTDASTYNADGTLASRTLPAAGTGAGRLAAETLTYGYSPLGQPTTLTGTGGYVTETDYDSLGNKIGAFMSDGGRTLNEIWAYEYGTDRLAEHGAQDPDLGLVYQDTYYAHDNAGNVTAISNLTNQYGAGPDDNQCLRYDYLRRLTEAWTPGSGNCATNPAVAGLGGPAPYWQTFGYDATGNRTSQTDHAAAGNTVRAATFPAAAAPQPHTLLNVVSTPPVGAATTDTYAYDPAGDTKTRTLAGKPAQTLGWDVDGHLASVVDSAGTSGYVYDADGHRLIARDPAGATLYLPDQEVRAAGGSVVDTRRYGTVASRTAAGGLTWITADPHGTGEVALKAADLSASVRYATPYGGPRGTAVTWPNTHGFVDGTADPTGLTHIGARDYDPATGRFISGDPVLDVADPQQMHGYSYADDAPTTLSDPTGREPGSWCNPGQPECVDNMVKHQTAYPMEVPPNLRRKPATGAIRITITGPPPGSSTPHPNPGPGAATGSGAGGAPVAPPTLQAWGDGRALPPGCEEFGTSGAYRCPGSPQELTSPTANHGMIGICVGASLSQGFGISATVCITVDQNDLSVHTVGSVGGSGGAQSGGFVGVGIVASTGDSVDQEGAFNDNNASGGAGYAGDVTYSTGTAADGRPVTTIVILVGPGGGGGISTGASNSWVDGK
jgi:RHS repeat-associated protein